MYDFCDLDVILQETEMRMDKELELRKLADELDMAKAKASQFAKVYFNLLWYLIHRYAFLQPLWYIEISNDINAYICCFVCL